MTSTFWQEDKIKALATAALAVTQDPVVGTNQTGKAYQEKTVESFKVSAPTCYGPGTWKDCEKQTVFNYW